MYCLLKTNNKGCMKIYLQTCFACSTTPVYSAQISKNTTQRKLYYTGRASTAHAQSSAVSPWALRFSLSSTWVRCRRLRGIAGKEGKAQASSQRYNHDAASHMWRVHELLDYVVTEMQLFNALGDGGAFFMELGFLLVRVVMMNMMQQM